MSGREQREVYTSMSSSKVLNQMFGGSVREILKSEEDEEKAIQAVWKTTSITPQSFNGCRHVLRRPLFQKKCVACFPVVI